MKIYVWPDGTWVAVDDYCEVADAWRGDDYYTLDVPDSILHEDVDTYVAEHGQDSVCNVEDQHGEPYCHTHKCSPSDPCIVKGCPHCTGEQKVVYGSDEDDPSKSYYPAFKASLNGTDQGNDSLGLGMVKVTWKEDGCDADDKPSATQSHQVPSTQVTAFCAHLAGAGHCIDILVNGMHENDYIDMVRGNTK